MMLRYEASLVPQRGGYFLQENNQSQLVWFGEILFPQAIKTSFAIFPAAKKEIINRHTPVIIRTFTHCFLAASHYCNEQKASIYRGFSIMGLVTKQDLLLKDLMNLNYPDGMEAGTLSANPN